MDTAFVPIGLDEPYRVIISEDPIGLAGGINQFAYVHNRPTMFVDPWGLAPGDPFPNMDATGIDAINYINPTSISQNREYGGYIYQNPNGTYSYTTPVRGTNSSVNIGVKPSNATGWFHTHGAYDPNYKNEDFSPADKNISRNVGPGYLGTPSNAIKKYDPNSGSEINLGQVKCKQ